MRNPLSAGQTGADLQNSVSVRGDSVDIVEILRVALSAEDIEFEATPTRLEGGRSAELFRFRLLAGPQRLVGEDLVLRLLPGPSACSDECVIQDGVARLGYPAPEVLQWGTADARPYMVLKFVEGRSLFDAGSRLSAFRRVPAQLADLMIALHRLDAAPVREALTATSTRFGLDARARALSEIHASFAAAGHRAGGDLCTWLDQHQPDRGPQVVCHGDLHALNVIVNGHTAVLDWELAAIGDPAFDIARTKLLLHAVPMDLPKSARPVIERLGQRAAERFERSYTAVSRVPRNAIDWYEALHAARVLGLLLASGVGGGSNQVLDGWAPTQPLLGKIVERRTGVSMVA